MLKYVLKRVGMAALTLLIIVFLLTYLQQRIKRTYMLQICMVAFSLSGIFYCRTSDYYTGLGLMIGFFLAQHFDDRFVRFEPIRYGEDKLAVLWTVLRMLGGIAIYYVLNSALKLPFSKEFLESGTAAAFLVRTLRYMIVTFVDLGLYPMAFRLIERRGK